MKTYRLCLHNSVPCKLYSSDCVINAFYSLAVVPRTKFRIVRLGFVTYPLHRPSPCILAIFVVFAFCRIIAARCYKETGFTRVY